MRGAKPASATNNEYYRLQQTHSTNQTTDTRSPEVPFELDGTQVDTITERPSTATVIANPTRINDTQQSAAAPRGDPLDKASGDELPAEEPLPVPTSDPAPATDSVDSSAALSRGPVPDFLDHPSPLEGRGEDIITLEEEHRRIQAKKMRLEELHRIAEEEEALQRSIKAAKGNN